MGGADTGGVEGSRWIAGTLDEGSGAFTERSLSVALQYDDSSGSGEWWVRKDLDVKRSCASDCPESTLVLVVPTADPTELATASVNVTMPDGSAPSVPLSGSSVDKASRRSYLAMTLPSEVHSGEVVHIVFHMQKSISAEADGVLECLAPSLGGGGSALFAGNLCAFEYGDGASTHTGLVLDGIPAVPSDHDTLDTFTISTTVTMPSYLSWGPVASGPLAYPGSGGGDSSTFGPSPPLRNSDFEVLLFESLTPPVTHTSAGGGTINALMDPELPASVSTYRAGTSGADTLGGALSWIEGYLGAESGNDWYYVMLRNHAGTGNPATGLTVPGITVIDVASAAGALNQHWKTDALHEVVHIWARAPADDKALWVTEGAPVLLSIMADVEDPYTLDSDDLAKHYGSGTTWTFSILDVLHVAAETHADRQCTGGAREQGLEGTSSDAFTHYYIGAYMLSQAYFTFRGRGGSSSTFWSALSDRLQTTGGLDAAGVAAFLSTDLGLPVFYEEQVKQGSAYGTPLLNLNQISTAFDSVDVFQVQRQLFTGGTSCPRYGDFNSFFDVPYYLVCGDPSSLTTTNFAECLAADGAPLDDKTVTPYLLSSSTLYSSPIATETLALTPIGSSPWPSYVWVAANDTLVPGHVPMAGRGSARDGALWWSGTRRALHCTLTNLYDKVPGCVTDADGDNHPVDGDCNDHDLTVAPAEGTADVLDGLYVDKNCDSWVTARP